MTAGVPGGPGEAEQPLTLKDVVGHLVKQAKGKGVVTYDQLNALLPLETYNNLPLSERP
jgi:hypothetical protein